MEEKREGRCKGVKTELLLITVQWEASKSNAIAAPPPPPPSPSSVKSPHRKTCSVFWCMTASRPVIIETCPSALCSTRSPPVSPIWVVLSCGCVAKQHGEAEDGVSLSWSAEGRLMILMPDFPKSSKCCLEVWCLAGPHAPSAEQVMSCHCRFTNGMLQHLDIVVVAGWKTMSHFIRSLLAESCSSH